jgi:hypothetical protein
MANWFTKQLGGAAPAPPQPPASPYAPGAVPSGFVPGTWPGSIQPHPQAPGAPQQPPMGAHQGPFYTFTAQGAMVADDGTVQTIYDAAMATGGSKNAKESTGVCPNCHQATLFDQNFSENGQRIRPLPNGEPKYQARCTTCNWPNLQLGSQNGRGSGVKAKGRPRPARQLPASHQVTVLDGGQTITYEPQPERR